MAKAGGEKSLIGRDAEGDGLVEPVRQLARRFLARRAMADDLGDHRIVIRGNIALGAQRGFDAQPLGRPPAQHPARLRHEIMRRVLGAQARLDRVAGKPDILLPQRQPFAAGDAQLQLDEIEPGDRFGHGMLDLQARVHFHEIERAGRIEQKFERARALVADRLDGRDRDRAHALAQLGRHRRGGRLLDQLLMAPLHRAIALAEMNRVAPAVAENLDFDMARRFDRALQHHRRVAERALRLGLARRAGVRRTRPRRAPAACRVRRRPPPP